MKQLNKIQDIPPLSPALLLGLVLRPVFSKPLVQPWLHLFAWLLTKKHPRIVECLEEFKPVHILIDPTDFPFTVIISIKNKKLSISHYSRDRLVAWDASITGSLPALIQLMQGEVDGDTLFFTRELRIEGRTEVIVALRNTLDGEQIDIKEDILSALGRLGKPAEKIAAIVERYFQQFNEDLCLIHAATTGPISKRCHQQAQTLDTLTQKMSTLEKELNKNKAIIKSLRKKIREEE